MRGYTILNGGDLDENGNSKGENQSCMVRKMYHGYLNENCNLKRKPIMHGYRISHGGDLNEIDNLKI